MSDVELTEMLVEASLNLLPPRIRHSLLDDAAFLSEWQIKTSTGVTLNRGGPALKREDLYDTFRKAIAKPNASFVIRDNAGKEWNVAAKEVSGELRFSLTDGSVVVNISDHTALSANPAQRLEWFTRAAKSANLSEVSTTRWKQRLSGEPLTDDEFESLHQTFLAAPAYVVREIQKVIATGNANVEALVPSSIDYYEQLVGGCPPDDSVSKYVRDELNNTLERSLDWNVLEGMRLGLLLGLSGQASANLPLGKLQASELDSLINWLETAGDPLSKVAGIEALLRRLDEFPQYEPHIARLALSIIEDDPKRPGSAIALMSSLVILVGGEIARRRIAASRQPFWSRLAAFAHGSLLVRAVIQARLDPTEVTTWAKSQGIGHIFFLRGLIDLRLEPRWLPDFVSGQQMRSEFIGRMANAAEQNREKIKTADLRATLLEEDGALRRAIRIPFAMLPGPLEGNLPAPLQVPEEVLREIANALAADSLTPISFAGLVNGSLLYGISADLSALAADALRRVKYSVENDGDEATLFGLIGGLGTVAAVTRSADLADELRILTRVLRRRMRLVVDPEDEMRVAMIAGASRSELAPWAEFVGEWITEIAFETSDKNKAARLLMKVRRLVQLERALAAPLAMADAALSGFSDWR